MLGVMGQQCRCGVDWSEKLGLVQGFAAWGGGGGQGGFLGSRLQDGAGSYPVAPWVAPSPTE